MWGLPKGPGDSAGWGKDFGGRHVAIEENEPEETRVSGVSRREDNTLNRGTYKHVRSIGWLKVHKIWHINKLSLAPLRAHRAQCHSFTVYCSVTSSKTTL